MEEKSIKPEVIGRKLKAQISLIEKIDSSNRSKYPTQVEIKKSISMKNLLDRKAWSNPDSSHNIQVLQKAIKKQLAPEFQRKFSHNPKSAQKLITTEIKHKKERESHNDVNSDQKKMRKKNLNVKTAEKPKKFRKTEKIEFRKTTLNVSNLKSNHKTPNYSDARDATDSNHLCLNQVTNSLKNVKESIIGKQPKKRPGIISKQLLTAPNILTKKTLNILYKERNEKKLRDELERKRQKQLMLKLDDFNKRIRAENSSTCSKSTKRKKSVFPWGIDQRKFKQGCKTESNLHLGSKKQLILNNPNERRRDIGVKSIDIERAKKQKVKVFMNKIHNIEEIVLRETLKKAMTDRNKGDTGLKIKKKKKKAKSKKINFKLEDRVKNLARSKSRKKLKTLPKSKSQVDLGVGATFRKQFFETLTSGQKDKISPEIHKKFEKICANYKETVSKKTPKKMVRSSTKPVLTKLQKESKKNVNQRQVLEDVYKKLSKKLDTFNKYETSTPNYHSQLRKGNPRKTNDKKRNKSLVHNKNHDPLYSKLDDSESSIPLDEISNVSTKFRKLNAAATFIQKIFKGYLTRKKLQQLFEEYEMEMEEQEGYTEEYEDYEMNQRYQSHQISNDEKLNGDYSDNTATKIQKRVSDLENYENGRYSLDKSSDIMLNSYDKPNRYENFNNSSDNENNIKLVGASDKKLKRDKSRQNIQANNIELEPNTDEEDDQIDLVNYCKDLQIQQLQNWNEVNKLMESLKGNSKNDENIKQIISQLHQTTSVNIQTLQSSIRKVEGISRNNSRSSLKKKPIKLELSLDIQKVNQTFKENTLNLPNYPSVNRSYNQSRSFENGTSSMAHSSRKSLEKFIIPSGEMMEKKNIDLARAILIDNEALNSSKSSQQFNNNDFSYLKSEQSFDEDDCEQNIQNINVEGLKSLTENASNFEKRIKNEKIMIMDNLNVPQPGISKDNDHHIVQDSQNTSEKFENSYICNEDELENFGNKTENINEEESVDELICNEDISGRQSPNIIEHKKIERQDTPIFKEEEIPQKLESSLVAQEFFDDEEIELPEEGFDKEEKVNIITDKLMSFLVDEMMMDGFILRELIKLQGEVPKGIKTNINSVKNYLSSLNDFIIQKFGNGVVQQLNNPLGPTPEERLRLFHAVSDEDNLDDSYAKINYEQVLDIEIYFEFEDKIMNEGDKVRYDPFQVEVEHIHNKLLFDCLNESLDSFRVFGLKGMPLPLKNGGRINKQIKSSSIKNIVSGAGQKVVEWSTFMCGFIPFKDDSFIQVPRFLDDDTLTQIKEDRLVRLLTEEVPFPINCNIGS